MRIHRWLLTALGTAVLIVLSSAFPVAAHTELVGSDPPEGSVLAAAPRQVTLTFTQSITAELATVTLRADDEQPRVLDVRVTGNAVSASVPPMDGSTPGSTSWLIGYRVVAADGHPITGQVAFSVEATGQATASPGAPQPAAPAGATESSQTARPDRLDSDDSQTFATIVIGLFTAVTTVGTMYLLARGRRNGEE